jgi:Mrp family chromosome partitioning ATPase/capsular polysaccharide biosynthesis protein
MILIAVVLATAGVYVYYARKPNVYTAGTNVYVIDPGDPVTGQPSPAQTDRQVLDQAGLLASRTTAKQVAQQIGYKGSPSDLLGQVSITSKQGEDFVNISSQGSTPKQAAEIANAFAQTFVGLLTTSENQRINKAIQLSEAQLASVGPGIAAETTRGVLAAELDRLQLAQKDPPVFAQQVETALPPSAPSAPKPLRNAVFALVLTLVLAIGLAYGLERFDRRLKSPDEVEGAYRNPLLAVLPHTRYPAPTKDGAALLSSDFREPFRVLRTNIELASLDAPPKTIVITSATPGEGKSTVVRNLALAFREAGKRVAVVDLDLRHPALAPMFGVERGPGLTDVLRHGAELGDVAHEIPAEVHTMDELLRTKAGRNGKTSINGNGHLGSGLTLLLGGPRPANPTAVMASERIAEVLNELREDNDLVLIDSAPLLAVTDTVPLLRYADAVIFVGRLGSTTRETAKRLMDFVDRVPDVNVLGVVANDLSRLDADAYGYGYGYGAYGADPQPLPDEVGEPVVEEPTQAM